MSVCKICSQELTIVLDPEDFNEATSSAAGGSVQEVPDDLLLSCGCHFHWQCLLDESPQLAVSLSCPSCGTSISSVDMGRSSHPQVFTRYHNEGGVQDHLDIFPLITEEAYLDANPTARPARAFVTMCCEGDVGGIIELLKAIEEDSDEGDLSPTELLRYQDPLDRMRTALHLALEKSQQETVWLLLWLASGLPTTEFPEAILQAAEVMGAGRETAQGPDIRGIRDVEGRRAEDVARAMGSTWAETLRSGALGV